MRKRAGEQTANLTSRCCCFRASDHAARLSGTVDRRFSNEMMTSLSGDDVINSVVTRVLYWSVSVSAYVHHVTSPSDHGERTVSLVTSTCRWTCSRSVVVMVFSCWSSSLHCTEWQLGLSLLMCSKQRTNHHDDVISGAIMWITWVGWKCTRTGSYWKYWRKGQAEKCRTWNVGKMKVCLFHIHGTKQTENSTS